MMRKISAFSLPAVLLFFFFCRTAMAAGKLTALEIMQRVEEADKTRDQRSIVKMTMTDALGNTRHIEMLRFHKHYGGRNGIDSKSVFFTQIPPDQKGTGFLIWDYAEEGRPDDLWLYLPSLRSIRRMTTRDQHDSFMGSDLTFADMGSRRLDEDTHHLVFEGRCRGLNEPCYVVDSIPKEKNSPYGKKRYFISKKDWVPRKVEFYDRNMKPLKLQIIQWQRVDGALAWRRSEIINVQTKHRTVFEIGGIKNNTGLEDTIFTERMLVRGGAQ